MGQAIKVSIIIPVYKVEQYIERCVESVLHQTYRNLEVIFVDDCSPDRSMDLAKKCIEASPLSNDLLFGYLKHDRNRGLSAARNTGIGAATGEYVYFLDSDDEISHDCIEKLTRPLDKRQYDFVVGNYRTTGTDITYPQSRFEGAIIGSHEITLSYLRNEWYPMAWNKLCRMGYLKNGDMYFLEGLIHEDELWSFQLACTAQSLYSINRITYFYHIRENSITTENSGVKNERKISHCLRALKGMYQFQEKHQLLSDEVVDLIKVFAMNMNGLMTKEHYSARNIYRNLRSADTRSLRTKLNIYKSLRDKVLNLDLFLPVSTGYAYKCLLAKYFQWRTR